MYPTAALAVLLALCVFGAAGNPMVIGHRGNSKHAPENTLAAFQQCLDLGADGIEIDLRLSVDNEVVLVHDASVDRSTDGSGSVADMTLAELKALDAGCWKGEEFCGERIPTLDEMLEQVEGTGIIVIMDLKVDGLGEYIRAALDRVGDMDDQVIASCRSDAQAADMMKHLPASLKQRLGVAPPVWDSNNYFMSAIESGLSSFSLSYSTVSDAFLLDASRHLMPVAGWTVNNEDDMEAMVRRGFSAILTDDVPLAQAVVNGTHLSAAAGRPIAAAVHQQGRAISSGEHTMSYRANTSTGLHNALIVVAAIAVNVFLVSAAISYFQPFRRSAPAASVDQV